MKLIRKSLILSLIFSLVLTSLSCNHDAENKAKNIDNNYDPLELKHSIKQWKNQKVTESDKREVALTVTEDIDYLFWTNSNDEVLYTDKNYRFMPTFYGNEKLSFSKSDKPYVFDFSNNEPGLYMLDIHYKDIKKNSDNDFRGFVNITGNNLVSISDKINGQPCGEACDKMARFTIHNDSKELLKNIHDKVRPGNVMTEFFYVDYESNKTHYDYTYATKFKLRINLEPGKYTNVLLPMTKDKDVMKNGFLLKKVINDGKEIYYGNTVTNIYKTGFGSPMRGSVNNDFIPQEDNKFYSDWNWRH